MINLLPPVPSKPYKFEMILYNWFIKIHKYLRNEKEKRAFVNILDYGGAGDGNTNNDAAFAKAIAFLATRGGGTLYIPAGQYKITVPIALSTGDITLLGDGQYSSRIAQTTTTSACITTSGIRNQVEKLGFLYTGTPGIGATAIYCSVSDNIFRDIFIYGCHIGVEVIGPGAIGVTGVLIDRIQIHNYVKVGVYIHDGCGDVLVSNFIFNAGNATNGALGGIRLYKATEAVSFLNGDILMGVYPMTVDSDFFVAGGCPAYNNFVNVYFDSAVQAVSLNNCGWLNFTNCWFSNGRSGGGNDGCTIYMSESLRFTDCRFFNCGGYGAFVSATTERIVFKGCQFNDNSVTAGSGVCHGVGFAANTNDFVVQASSGNNGYYPGGQQGYFAAVIGGTSDRYIIADNLVTGNVTGGIFDGGTGANKRVANNY